jgi:hypothetical protein
LLGTRARVDPLPNDSIDAVRDTLKKMVAIVRKYSGCSPDFTTVNHASALLSQNGIRDTRMNRYQIIKLFQNWVRDGIGYAHDPYLVEMIQTPPRTLDRGFGDCDDKAILLCSLLSVIGFECEFLAVGGVGEGWDSSPAVKNGFYDPNTIPDYSHVLCAVRFGRSSGRRPAFLDGWLTLETIVPSAGPGWFPPGTRVIMPAHI